FSICGIGALCLMAYIIYRNRKKIERDNILLKIILFAITGLVASILISACFGMTTRTSAGDRLMYLPSVFYSILIAVLIVRLIGPVNRIIIVCALILVFQDTFLLINQNNWIRASEHEGKVISSIAAHSERPLFIISLPSDENG